MSELVTIEAKGAAAHHGSEHALDAVEVCLVVLLIVALIATAFVVERARHKRHDDKVGPP